MGHECRSPDSKAQDGVTIPAGEAGDVGRTLSALLALSPNIPGRKEWYFVPILQAREMKPQEVK